MINQRLLNEEDKRRIDILIKAIESLDCDMEYEMNILLKVLSLRVMHHNLDVNVLLHNILTVFDFEFDVVPIPDQSVKH